MLWTAFVFVFTLVVQKCTSVILHLSESEHERLPTLFALDDYGRCMRRGGTYCMLQADLVAEPGNELMTLIQEYSAYKVKHFNYSHIDRGICVQSSCQDFMDDEKSMNEILESCVNASIWREYGLQARLSQLHQCSTKVGPKPDSADWAVAALLAVIVLLNAVGTCYDLLTRDKEKVETNTTKTRNQYLLSFSLLKNWECLFNSGPQLEKLGLFHGARAISGFFVVMAHLSLVLAKYIDNSRDFEMKYNRAASYILINGGTTVHMYFVISGFLLVHLLLTLVKNPHSWSFVPKIMLYRIWRFTPSHAVMFAISATWLRHLGSGPLWYVDVESSVDECRAYWWHHLLYINNYVPGVKLCGLQNWHLASEIQLFFVGLVVHMATTGGGRCRTLTFLLLLGLVVPALQVAVQDVDLTVTSPEIHRYLMRDSHGHHKVNRLGHNNLTPYILGMATGYLVHRWRNQGVDLSKVKMLGVIEWCALLSMYVYFMISGVLYYAVPDLPGLGARVLYTITNRLVVATTTSLVIITFMLNRRETSFSSMFSWRGWVLPSKLSYGVFLNHMTIIQIFAGARTQLVHATFFYSIVIQIGVYVISNIAAVPLYLLVEGPARLLSAAVMNRSNKSMQKTM